MKMSKKIKFMGLGICCVVLAGAVSGCTAVSATQSNQDYIGEEKAKAIALEHAGVSEGDANFVLSKFDMDDGVAEYEVEFWSESTEYDYEIDAVTGEIRSYDYDMETNVSSAQPQTQTGTESEDYIGEEKAKAIALEHAGVSEGEANFVLSKFDMDDGVAEYEVEFWSESTEYDYEIDAVTGEIRSYDYDMETNVSSAQPQTQTGTESEDYIGEEKAKAIALEHAGVSEGEASYFKCEFDYDDGRAEYEIEWQIGRTEYEYTISAVDGTILERDVDRDD